MRIYSRITEQYGEITRRWRDEDGDNVLVRWDGSDPSKQDDEALILPDPDLILVAEERGRVILFINDPTEDIPEFEVFAVPGHWDDDDIERFVQSMSERWERAAVTEIKEVPDP